MANLDLRPGRRCWIVQWAPIKSAGKCCVIGEFIGLANLRDRLTMVNEVHSDLWEVVDVDGRPPEYAPCAARALWLIPIADDDEGKTLFGEREKPLEVADAT